MGRMFFPQRVSSEGCHLESVWRVELSARAAARWDLMRVSRSRAAAGRSGSNGGRAAGLCFINLGGR